MTGERALSGPEMRGRRGWARYLLRRSMISMQLPSASWK
jgi:hypothetical protein